MNVANGKFTSIEQMTGQLYRQNVPASTKHTENSTSFESILSEKESESLHFSKHANERLATRNISLTDAQLNRLEDGTAKAKEKGIKESLVMVDNLAFIVNVKSNTVVTAVNEIDHSVFTNIDGAVIV